MKVCSHIFNDYQLITKDGYHSSVTGAYLNTKLWRLEYLVVSTGRWIKKRSSLIPVESVKNIDPQQKLLAASIMRFQVLQGPPAIDDEPIYSDFEKRYWQNYFKVSARPASTHFVGPMNQPNMFTRLETQSEERSLLYSIKALCGRKVNAIGGNMGRLHDIIIDCTDWGIKGLVVKSRAWPLARPKLVPTHWVRQLNWQDDSIELEIQLEATDSFTSFIAKDSINRTKSHISLDYFGRPRFDKSAIEI